MGIAFDLGTDHAQGFFDPTQDIAGDILPSLLPSRYRLRSRLIPFETLLQPEVGFEEGAVIGSSPTASEVFIRKPGDPFPAKDAFFFTENLGTALSSWVVGLCQEGAGFIAWVVFDEEAGASRADEISGAQAAMHGLADAFARLGRMAHADDGAVIRLSESERVKEGACLIRPVHVRIAKKL